MGISNSIDQVIDRDSMEVYKAMRFTKSEISKLYDVFQKHDREMCGLSTVQWLTMLDSDRTHFTERAFNSFDKDSSSRLSFKEFVVSLWKFCTLGSAAISIFAFDIYDTNGDGLLTAKQTQQLFKDLYGSKQMESETSRAALAEMLRKSDDGTVSIDQFRAFSHQHQQMFQPVFLLQVKMKRAAFGESFWENFAKRRINLRKGYNIPLVDLMTLHADRHLYNTLLEDESALGLVDMMKRVLELTDSCIYYRTPDNSLSLSGTERHSGRVKLLSPIQEHSGGAHSEYNVLKGPYSTKSSRKEHKGSVKNYSHSSRKNNKILPVDLPSDLLHQ